MVTKLLSMALLWPSVSPAARLAVLELKSDAPLRPAAVRYLGDRVRGVAQARVGQTLVLMTRDNILALLPPGATLADCEGECEIETGRNIGADYVVGGRILPFGGALRAVLTLHATQDGRQLAAVHAGGDDVASLEADLARGADRLFDALPHARPKAPPTLIEARLILTSHPAGATVLRDGRPLGETPLQVAVEEGWRGWLEFRLAGHVAQRRWLALAADKDSEVEVRLLPTRAPIRVEARTPDGIPCVGDVRVDARIVGRNPWQGVLDQGRHRLEVGCGHRQVDTYVSWPQAQAQVIVVAHDHAVELAGQLLAPGGWRAGIGGWFMDRRAGRLRVGLMGRGGRYPLQHVDPGYDDGAWHLALDLRFAVPLSARLDWTLDLEAGMGWADCAEAAEPDSDCARKDRADTFDPLPLFAGATGLRFDTGWWVFDGGLMMIKPLFYQGQSASVVPYVGTSLAL